MFRADLQADTRVTFAFGVCLRNWRTSMKHIIQRLLDDILVCSRDTGPLSLRKMSHSVSSTCN